MTLSAAGLMRKTVPGHQPGPARCALMEAHSDSLVVRICLRLRKFLLSAVALPPPSRRPCVGLCKAAMPPKKKSDKRPGGKVRLTRGRQASPGTADATDVNPSPEDVYPHANPDANDVNSDANDAAIVDKTNPSDQKRLPVNYIEITALN